MERFFNRIKQCRRVATRYDKLAANYLAFIKLAAIRIWLRAYESTPSFITHAPLDDEFNSLISATSTVPVADSVM